MFLTVITRHYTRRPSLFASCLVSLCNQTDLDFEHLVIKDSEGRGVAWANRQFAVHAGEVQGDYVLMLDDDDAMADDEAVALLKEAAKDMPDLVMFKADHGPLGILPAPEVWGGAPIHGRIGGIDFITRRDVWQKHIAEFGRVLNEESPSGDWHFLKSIWAEQPRVVWFDRLLTRVQRISQGAAE